MHIKNKNILRFILLSVGLIILGFMVYKIGVMKILEGLYKVRWWFFVIMALWLLIYILNTVSWRFIIRSEKNEAKIPILKLLKITVSGFAVNYITPFVALGGEPYKVFELKDYMNTAKATSCVILYSMMHVFSHIIFWMASILLALLYIKPAWFSTVLLLCLFAFFFFAVALFLRGYKKGLLVRTFRVSSKIPLIKKITRKIYNNNLDKLKEIDQQIVHLHTHRRLSFYCSFVAEFLSRVAGCFEVSVIMYALSPLYPQISVTVADAIIITAGYSLFANLVFFVPMQIGSREGGYMLAFETVGLPSAPALIVSLLTRIRELFWILIGFMLMRIGTGTKIQIEHNNPAKS
ncbi:MAG: flippase-like domain-containing protein [Prevotellaceae bacterium]|jgi:hypothetical protein|nr:flippase-like domain-containing protein [Prevotellaceae bacterium]